MGDGPRASVESASYEQMGFRADDEQTMRVPLDWIGFHYHTRRIVSDARAAPGSAILRRRRRTWRAAAADRLDA